MAMETRMLRVTLRDGMSNKATDIEKELHMSEKNQQNYNGVGEVTLYGRHQKNVPYSGDLEC